MRQNKLNVNEEKTEVIVIDTKRNRGIDNVTHLRVRDSIVESSPAAQNLSVTIDHSLFLEQHSLAQLFYAWTVANTPLANFLKTANLIVHATIISRLD